MYVYLGGPFFNEPQIQRVETVKNILTALGIRFFSPKDECMFKAGVTTPQQILDLNLRAIDNASLLIAITDDKDTGTMFEAGYCYAKGLPILYLWLTGDKSQKFNLMLGASGHVVRSFEELVTTLGYFKEVGEFPVADVTGIDYE